MVAVIAALFLTKHNANVTILSDHLNCVRFVGTMRQVAWENLMPIRWESKKPADLHQWLTTEATASHANIKHVKAHTDATDRSQNSTTGQTDWPRQPTVEHIWCSRLSYSVHDELRGIHHGLLVRPPTKTTLTSSYTVPSSPTLETTNIKWRQSGTRETLEQFGRQHGRYTCGKSYTAPKTGRRAIGKESFHPQKRH